VLTGTRRVLHARLRRCGGLSALLPHGKCLPFKCCAHARTHAQTHPEIHIRTRAARAHTQGHTRAHTHAPTHTHTHTQTHTHTHTYSLTHSFTRAQARTHAPARTRAHTHTRAHAPTWCYQRTGGADGRAVGVDGPLCDLDGGSAGGHDIVAQRVHLRIDSARHSPRVDL
jgi:hypothetical protein